MGEKVSEISQCVDNSSATNLRVYMPETTCVEEPQSIKK